MKVLHVIPSLAPVHGGPSRAVPVMETALTNARVHVETATTNDHGPGKRMDIPEGVPINENGVIRWYFQKETEFYKVSRPLKKWLQKEIFRFDIIHVHALFSYTSVIACRIAKKAGIPYVIRPLGVLNAYGINNSKSCLKSLSLRFVEGPLIRGAAAMHFISDREKTESERLDYPMRSWVIPIGLEPASPGDPQFLLERHSELVDKKIVVFLGRINLVKGIELLIESVSKIMSHALGLEFRLIIAGTGDEVYVNTLKEMTKRLGVAEKIIWIGHVKGAEKASLMEVADLFVFPSESESFGIALVEALAAGKPTLVSTGIAIANDVHKAGACRVVERTPGLWAEAIADLLGDSNGRTEMGRRAKEFARSNYSLDVMGKGLVDLYRSVVAPDTGGY